jgi:hypothetical protein
MKPPGDHEVQNEPKITFQADCDSFANSPQSAHDTTLNIRNRRFCRAQQKWARYSHMFQRLAQDARFKRADVSGDIRQFRHGRLSLDAREEFPLQA